MKATLYDAHGNPTHHLEYDTAFEKAWRGVGYAVAAAIVGFLLLIVICAIVVTGQDARNKATLDELHNVKGLRLYDVWDDLRSPSNDEFLLAHDPEDAIRIASSRHTYINPTVHEQDDSETLLWLETHGRY